MIIYSYNNINGNSSQVIELLFLHFIYQVLCSISLHICFRFLYLKNILEISRIQIVKYEMDR